MDYWIGDRVYIKSLEKYGTFEGMVSDNTAKLKVDSKIMELNTKDFTVVDEDEMKPKFTFKEEIIEKPQVENSIDLHMEKLNPGMKNQNAILILNHQIKAAKKFVQNAIDHRKGIITVIHGKGDGVLESELLSLLKDFDNIYIVENINNGGAKRIWLRY